MAYRALYDLALLFSPASTSSPFTNSLRWPALTSQTNNSFLGLCAGCGAGWGGTCVSHLLCPRGGAVQWERERYEHINMPSAGSKVHSCAHGTEAAKMNSILGLPFCGYFQPFLKLMGIGFPCKYSNTSHFIALSLSFHVWETGVMPTTKGHWKGASEYAWCTLEFSAGRYWGLSRY